MKIETFDSVVALLIVGFCAVLAVFFLVRIAFMNASVPIEYCYTQQEGEREAMLYGSRAWASDIQLGRYQTAEAAVQALREHPSCQKGK